MHSNTLPRASSQPQKRFENQTDNYPLNWVNPSADNAKKAEKIEALYSNLRE